MPSKEAIVRQVPAEDPGRADRWIAEATGNGIVVHRLRPMQVVSAIRGILLSHDARRLLVNMSGLEEQLCLHAAWGGIQLARWGDAGCRDEAFSADATVTSCRYAIADTGAILAWSDQGFGRSSTLTAPVHIVIVRQEQVLADLVDAMRQLAAQAGSGLPSNVVIMNGPSKTTDIEGNLVVGVHGPRHLYAIVVED